MRVKLNWLEVNLLLATRGSEYVKLRTLAQTQCKRQVYMIIYQSWGV